jgi:hypothetical protein
MFWMRSESTMPRADQRHRDDEETAEKHSGSEGIGQRIKPQEPIQVDRGNLRDVRQHDDRRNGQAPTADPSDPRPEGFGRPRECSAAIRCVPGQFPVSEGDQQHRDERQHEHRRRLLADGDNHETEGGGQAVGRRDRCESDDDVADQAERICLEALVALDVGWRFGD